MKTIVYSLVHNIVPLCLVLNFGWEGKEMKEKPANVFFFLLFLFYFILNKNHYVPVS